MIADSGREAAWQRYRESIPVRRVIQKPESGDVRLAFEAGYSAALRDLETFAALARDWRAKSQEVRESDDVGPVMLAIADELLVRADDIEHAIRKAQG